MPFPCEAVALTPSEQPLKLRTAMIHARELGRMTVFYRDALGLTPLPEQSSDGWVVFYAGGVQLAPHAIPPHVAAGIEILDPPTPREETPSS